MGMYVVWFMCFVLKDYTIKRFDLAKRKFYLIMSWMKWVMVISVF